MKHTISLKNAVAIDLFCGIGGLTYGLKQAGIKVAAGIDSDPDCGYAYKANNGAAFLHKDIKEISYKDLAPYYGNAKYRILVGCAPCQPFSSYTVKGKKHSGDSWLLINEFLRIIKEGMPEIISMENVPNLKNKPIFDEFVAALKKLGYAIDYKIVRCAEIGIPQSRKRLVLLGSLLGEIKVDFAKKPQQTVKDAIGKLPKLANGGANRRDPMHKCRMLSDINLQRIHASKPGGTWEDWDEALRTECHKRESGGSYKNVYGRMEWGKPSPTLTTMFCTYGTGRFGHPAQHRALSLREGALLQTFPPEYKFFPSSEEMKFDKITKHIGNAVPPALGKAIGGAIIRKVKNHVKV